MDKYDGNVLLSERGIVLFEHCLVFTLLLIIQ